MTQESPNYVLVKSEKDLDNSYPEVPTSILNSTPHSSRESSVVGKKTGRRTSLVWKVFKQIEGSVEKGNPTAKCDLCGEICRNPCGSTTAMRNHILRKHEGVMSALQDKHPIQPVRGRGRNYERESESSKIVNNSFLMENTNVELKEVPSVGFVTASGFPQNMSTNIPQYAFQQAYSSVEFFGSLHPDVQTNIEKYKSIAIMCVMDMLPLKTISTPAFRAMMGNCGGNNPIPVPSDEVLVDIVSTHVNNLYTLQKQELIEELQGKYICMTVEYFRHPVGGYFAFLTANYVSDDWQLQTKFLSAKHLSDINSRSTASAIQDNLKAVMAAIEQEFCIQRANIVGTILNTGGIRYTGNLACFDELIILPCLYEGVKLGFQNVMWSEQFSNLSSLIVDICEDHFPEVKTQSLNIGLFMSKFNELKDTLEEDVQAAGYSWEFINDLSSKLDPLNVIIELVQDSQGMLPLSVVMPLLLNLGRHYNSNNNNSVDSNSGSELNFVAEVQDFLMGLYEFKPDNHMNTGFKVLALSTFLDPRYKAFDMLNTDMIRSLLQFVAQLLTDSSETSMANQENPGVQQTKLSMFMEKTGQSDLKRNPHCGTNSEIFAYWQHPLVNNNTDPCFWWRMNSDAFPRLSVLAKKYLCLRGTSMQANVAFHDADAEFYKKLQGVEVENLDKFLFLRRSFPGKYVYLEVPPYLRPEEINFVTIKKEIPDPVFD